MLVSMCLPRVEPPVSFYSDVFIDSISSESSSGECELCREPPSPAELNSLPLSAIAQLYSD